MFAVLQDVKNVGRIEASERGGLSSETGSKPFVVRELLVKDFERDRAAKLRVDGLEDDAHAASSENLDDVIAPKVAADVREVGHASYLISFAEIVPG